MSTLVSSKLQFCICMLYVALGSSRLLSHAGSVCIFDYFCSSYNRPLRWSSPTDPCCLNSLSMDAHLQHVLLCPHTDPQIPKHTLDGQLPPCVPFFLVHRRDTAHEIGPHSIIAHGKTCFNFDKTPKNTGVSGLLGLED